MPLYEMVFVARIAEQKALINLIKTLSTTILANGGAVRSIDNLGDRVLPKSLKSKDGNLYSLGRFMKLEFDATPLMMQTVEKQTRNHDEVLRVNTNKMKEAMFMNRAMRRINRELSPFKDKETHDEDYIRAMWTRYSQL